MKVLRNYLTSLITSLLVVLICVFYRGSIGASSVLFISITATVLLFSFEALVRRKALERTVAIMKKHDSALFKNAPDSLDGMEDEIALWSKKQSEFLEDYKSREQFRREYIGNISPVSYTHLTLPTN